MAPYRYRRRLLLPGLALLVLIVPNAATGQVLTNIEFSFSNPGARSLGFGGAFVALADDATAAFANPAGLVQLSRPEISLEGRFWSYASPYTAGGRAAGTPTGLGIDTIAEPIRVDSEADLSGLSFVSFVYPKGRWSFAFYRHQLQKYELVQEIQGIFTPGPVAGAWRGPIERASFSFEIATQALALSYRANERLSLGLALARFDPSIEFFGSDYLPDDDTIEAYFARASFLPGRRTQMVRAQGSSSDYGIALGFLYSLTPRWRLGGAYREGPDLEFSAAAFAGPVHPDLPPGRPFVQGSFPWKLPDVYALGLAYRSVDGRWTAGLEWSRIEYSSILESVDSRFSAPGDRIDDADEIHLGGEYAFFRGRSVMAVRLGAWHDPDHQQHNETTAFSRAEIPGGDDELHLAAGFGVAFDNFQVDVGLDLSDLRDTASVSMIYSF